MAMATQQWQHDNGSTTTAMARAMATRQREYRNDNMAIVLWQSRHGNDNMGLATWQRQHKNGNMAMASSP